MKRFLSITICGALPGGVAVQARAADVCIDDASKQSLNACGSATMKEFDVGKHGKNPTVNFRSAPPPADLKKRDQQTKPNAPSLEAPRDVLHLTIEEVLARYHGRYAGEPLVRVADEAPWVSRIAGAHHVDIGGFTLSGDGKRLVVVATEDNLLKGAATQALQNLNLAFGLDEFSGIPV